MKRNIYMYGKQWERLRLCWQEVVEELVVEDRRRQRIKVKVPTINSHLL